MDVAVSRHCRADVYSDRRRVDQLHLTDAFSLYLFDMGGERLPGNGRFKTGDEAFQDHRGLSGTGYTGDDGKPSFGDFDMKGLHRVDRSGLHPDCAE